MNMNGDLLKLISNYQDVVKPLMADIEIRSKNNRIPINCLNEVRALNDHIARCFRDGMDEKTISFELKKAEGHLKRLIFDCFKQLNIYLYDKIEAKENKYYSALWLEWDEGVFWNAYLNAKTNARLASIEAKKEETVNQEYAMKKYEEAYCNYCTLEGMLNKKGKRLWLSFIYKFAVQAVEGWHWLITTIILSIIAAIVAQYF